MKTSVLMLLSLCTPNKLYTILFHVYLKTINRKLSSEEPRHRNTHKFSRSKHRWQMLVLTWKSGRHGMGSGGCQVLLEDVVVELVLGIRGLLRVVGIRGLLRSWASVASKGCSYKRAHSGQVGSGSSSSLSDGLWVCGGCGSAYGGCNLNPGHALEPTLPTAGARLG